MSDYEPEYAPDDANYQIESRFLYDELMDAFRERAFDIGEATIFRERHWILVSDNTKSKIQYDLDIRSTISQDPETDIIDHFAVHVIGSSAIMGVFSVTENSILKLSGAHEGGYTNAHFEDIQTLRNLVNKSFWDAGKSQLVASELTAKSSYDSTF